MVGPADPIEAQTLAPRSLRAIYGTTSIRNALHASDSIDLAVHEIQHIFPHYLYSSASMSSLFDSRPGTTRNSVTLGTRSLRGSLAGGLRPAKPERTLALIKPDAYPTKKEEILEKIVADGFTIVSQKEVTLDAEKAGEFYKEHLGKPFYETLTTWMSSAPIYAMVLEKVDSIKAWRKLAGPTNSDKAREESPESIRALFGTDGSQNAVHGSDSPASAAREINVIFGDTVSVSSDHIAPAKEIKKERTLALIKPDAYPAKKDEIVQSILDDQFTIVQESEVTFSKEQAEEFYKEHLGKPFYEELTSWMSSSPIYALVLEKEGAITAWRTLAGPTNSEKARETSPDSIRARFGTDGSKNAVHGSDSLTSAVREIGVAFNYVPKEKVINVEQTLALIKPDAYPEKKEAIMESIRGDGFRVVREEEVVFTKEIAEEFYKEHLGKGFYEELTNWMSSAPIYAVVLEKEGAIAAWRALAGPTNSEKARETSPDSIRARFGTDGSKNAVHGSDSPASAEREIKVVFAPQPEVAKVAEVSEIQQTLALIKPDAYPGKKDEIVARIVEDGFTIVKEAEVHFSKEKANEFYKEHEGKGFYEDLTTWMSRF
ncbi:nucleoside diphosphate kinase [Chytridium lagenaria]|nr:nucleoside diphosphate kinase [Chytridium lagenaria]